MTDSAFDDLIDRGAAAHHQNRFEEALASYQKALELRPGDSEAISLSGLALTHLGRIDEARPGLEQAVRQEPDQTGFRLNLVECLERAGEFELASQQIDIALRQNPGCAGRLAQARVSRSDWRALELLARIWTNVIPGDAAAWHCLAQATYEQGRIRQSVQAYQKVLDLSGRSAANLVAFGRICLHALEYERASEVLDEAERQDPDHVEALAAKGLLLIYRGRFDEALQYCRRCLELDPGYVPAYTQLSKLSKGHLSRKEQEVLESVSDDASIAAENRILATFALAHSKHADGDIDAAFDCYAVANAMQVEQSRMEGISYDASLAEARTDRLIERFADTKKGDAVLTGATPIFVVGMPRSGTTLIESALGAHSEVTACGERTLMPYLLDAYLTQSDNKTVTGDQLQAMAQSYLDEGPSRKGFITDKNPLNFESVGLILRMFPHAIIIHAKRDPAETGMSIFRHEFSKFWRFAHRLEDIGHYYGQYAKLMSHWQRLFGDRLITVQYEEFAANFPQAVRDLVARCSLPWQDACEHFQQGPSAIATFSAVQAREQVLLRSGVADAYEKQLAPLRNSLPLEAERDTAQSSPI